MHFDCGFSLLFCNIFVIWILSPTCHLSLHFGECLNLFLFFFGLWQTHGRRCINFGINLTLSKLLCCIFQCLHNLFRISIQTAPQGYRRKWIFNGVSVATSQKLVVGKYICIIISRGTRVDIGSDLGNSGGINHHRLFQNQSLGVWR